MKAKLRKLISIILCFAMLLESSGVLAYAVSDDDSDKYITISTAEEMLLIGTDVSMGGVTYSPDANYYIADEIPLSYSEIRTLSFDNFSGSIRGRSSDNTVYDSETDTIYIHNVYQLKLIGDEKEPVLSGDYDAKQIGIGQPYETDDGTLYYDDNHNYLVAPDFSVDEPKTDMEEVLEEDNNEEGEDDAAGTGLRAAPLLAASSDADYPDELNGREYFGEVVREMDGKNYILIGDQQQLRAIGSGKSVTEPVWKVYEERRSIAYSWSVVDNNPDYPIELYYPGDADLIKFDSNFDWSGKELFDVNSGGHNIGSYEYPAGGSALTATKRYVYAGSKLLNGNLAYDESKTSRNVNIGTAARYTYDANYIIFRDIFLTEDGTEDTNTVEWDPIDSFTGYMEGRLDMVEDENPTINNVEIVQDTNVVQRSIGTLLNPETETEFGVGFFRSLATRYDSVLTVNSNTIIVKNITLNDVSVETTATGITQDFSLIATLLTPLLNILGMSSGVQKDYKSLSTGAFAGVVNGKVRVSGCEVTNLNHVRNANDWTGGFVGYSTGIARYEALSGVTGFIAEALQSLLNLIPVLGLGDLIGVLLNGGVLRLSHLIPVGYTNAVFIDNKVSYTGSADVSGDEYTGGFVGSSYGSVFQNCDIEKSSSLSVSGSDYAGGFAGESSNVIISGLLTQLGIQVIDNYPVNSTMLGCDIGGNGSLNVSVSADETGSGYAGGFAGKMANSYAVDCSISGLSSVSGHDYVGGFTGYASTGELIVDESQRDLVNVVRALLASILNGSKDAQLLNLIGLRPSVIAGADISGGSISITASGKYAGGIAGYAGALKVVDTASLNESGSTIGDEIERVINANDLSYIFESNRNSYSASSVSVSSTDAAGGAFGKAEMTGVTGVLDGTATAVNYIKFELKNLDYDGGSISVSADNAGGMIGAGIGGEAEDVHVTGMSEVSGTSNAGGFGGSFGSGTMANIGGINLLGLNVVQIDSLLSVAQAVETSAADCSIQGVSSGYTVTSTASEGTSGGFIGDCVSGKTVDCSASRILSVSANVTDGFAGGFIGRAKAGDALSTVGEDIGSGRLSPLQISNLLGVMNALTPEFHGSSLSFVDNTEDQVTADYAGGFIGYGEAVDVNYSVNNDEGSSSSYTTDITNLGKVHGYSYAGGFAGKLQPGDVAQTGSVYLLGLLSVSDLLSVMDVAYPRISASSITGAPLEVTAEGRASDQNTGNAGGFIGDGKAVIVEDSDLSELASVNASLHAGGYIGLMHSGTAAQAGDASDSLINGVLGMVLNAGELAGVLQAASSDINNCKVSGISEGFTVEAYPASGSNMSSSQGYAGGFVGEMLSGHIDNHLNAASGGKGTAVENLKYVKGYRYAGGFGGRVASGSVIEIGERVSVLTEAVQAADILTLISAFVPEITDASVHSIGKGAYVHVTGTDEADSTHDVNTGSAGGYIGYACGLQLKRSDVDKLMHTAVKEPADLQSDDGSPYYSNESEYAVRSYKYSGGYFGKLDIGSTAYIGGGSVLSRLISLSTLTSALEVVLSDAEDCDVKGAAGGFNVLATNEDANKGRAGGFAGNVLGSRLKDCNSYNFAHIIGRVSAGGYAGTVEPGSVDESIENINVLGGLINASNLLGVVRSFVPEIINSETTCIPCGGVVRADAPAADGEYRGMAGGYCGYNYGAQIWGLDNDVIAPKENAAIRIRSVYGYEYAGGYTGLMRSADVADTGNISVLYGLIHLDNPLTLVQAIYPTEENTAVYGPLRGMDVSTWNAWVNAVAKYGPYGEELQALGPVSDQDELNSIIDNYAYGYAVTGGRKQVAETLHEGSAAGGYVGRMEGGTITNGHGYDMRLTEAFRAAGGFAGEMITADVVNVGGISLAGIDIVGSLPLLQTFVPVIKASDVDGYISGATVRATGADNDDSVGMAGGFAGHMSGGQIRGTESSRIKVSNIRNISGTSYVGGFVGRSIPGSAVTLNSESRTGLLSKVLGVLANSTSDLARVLGATVSTIRYVDVEAWDNYGLVINGAYPGSGATTEYAKAAGGFAGELSGTIVGEDGKENSGFKVKNLRKVIGGEYAGGGFGISDTGSLAQISAGNTSLIDIIELGTIDVLDAFRTSVYHSSVEGSSDAGLYVAAKTESEEGTGISTRYSGNGGGFAGRMHESTVKNCDVTNLAMTEALNYSGGFAGYMGRGGAVELKKIKILDNENFSLLGGSLSLLDVFGSNAEDCSVTGINDGYSVLSASGSEGISGGFVGFGDLSRVSGSSADRIKRIESDGIAGGFVGKTAYTHGADIQIESSLVNFILGSILNPIIRALYLAEGTPFDLPEIDLGVIKIALLYKDDLVSLNLFGLPISVSLSKASETDPGATDLAVINIGDSVIKLPCTAAGINNTAENRENIRISLIKANVGRYENSTAKGIGIGYDVHAAGDSGGFVGDNNDALFENNNMYFCDSIESEDGGKVGPFSARSSVIGHYAGETINNIEDNNNIYRVYRVSDAASINKANGSLISDKKTKQGRFSVYDVSHMNDITNYSEFEGAKIGDADLNVYVSAAKAVLMEDAGTKIVVPDSMTPVPSAIDDVCDEVRTLTVNKKWNMMYDHPHPNTIYVTVRRTYSMDGTDYDEVVQGYENIAITGDASASTWQYVIRDLPVYTRDNNDEIVYYHYSITESSLLAFTTVIQGDESTYTIENTEKPVVPTGTRDIGMLMTLLLLAEALLVLVIRKRSIKKKAAENTNTK